MTGHIKIGVFDSGIGGKAVAGRLTGLLPETEIIFVNDHKHVPYGSRPAREVQSLTEAAIQPLLAAHCDTIVIACNTATTEAIGYLRERYPNTPFVGFEPMVKPAAGRTKSGVIAVLATPGTLASTRYQHLKQTYAAHIKVIEPDCAPWATLIENNQAATVPVEATARDLLARNVDVIVLACTHYHWLKDRFVAAVNGHAHVLEPSDAIGARIEEILAINSRRRA